MSFDITQVRSRFPALQETDQIYFDNAGGSQVLGSVVDSICNYLTKTNVQLGASYATSQKSTKLYNAGVEAAAKHINASPEEVVIGGSTTSLLHTLSTALQFPAGSEFILSPIDHESNIAPWVRLAKLQGFKVIWWPVDPSPAPILSVEKLQSVLSAKTALVACTHASNLLGTINPIKAVAAAVHEANPEALVCVDAVAYAPHRPIDVKELGVDVYVFSWYKVFGPHISTLYVSHERTLPKVLTLGHFFHPQTSASWKLALAGSNYELTASIPRVLEYIDTVTWAGIAAHEEQLCEVLLSHLRSRDDLYTIHGVADASKEKRVAVISFSIRGRKAGDVEAEIEKRTKIGARAGHFYAKRMVDDLLADVVDKEDGVLRVSLCHYNTVEEVQCFLEALAEVVGE